MDVLKKIIRYNRGFELRNIFQTFFRNQSSGGIVLMVCAIAAITIANVPSWSHIQDYLNLYLGFKIGAFEFKMSILHWINDGLMAIFFFVVGLEIKREILVGELSSVKQAALPIFAALGGMVVPALIYFMFNNGEVSANGWGIPMATDIAFALGILSLLGKRVPLSLKIFLTALAIVDDLGAIIVLAVFYPTNEINFTLLISAACVLAIMVMLNYMKVRRPSMYIIPGVIVWLLFLGSGIHATIAGVLVAMTIPGKTTINEVRFIVGMKYLLNKFSAESSHKIEVLANTVQQQVIHNMHHKLKQVHPLMIKFEHGLHPWVTFLIMPIFALANAGVKIDLSLFTPPLEPIVPGIFLGLLAGKPIGIFLASWISVKLKIADLPGDISWMQILSAGIIAGIGFTMSIFIDNLAFSGIHMVNMGKAVILITSFVAAIAGLIAIYFSTKNYKPINNI
jgi:NhaA family Na+:H+ antiporter